MDRRRAINAESGLQGCVRLAHRPGIRAKQFAGHWPVKMRGFQLGLGKQRVDFSEHDDRWGSISQSHHDCKGLRSRVVSVYPSMKSGFSKDWPHLGHIQARTPSGAVGDSVAVTSLIGVPHPTLGQIGASLALGCSDMILAPLFSIVPASVEGVTFKIRSERCTVSSMPRTAQGQPSCVRKDRFVRSI